MPLTQAPVQGRVHPGVVKVEVIGDPESPETVATESIVLSVEPHPEVVRVLDAAGATRRSANTWMMGHAEHELGDPLWRLTELCIPGTIVPKTVIAPNDRPVNPLKRRYISYSNDGLAQAAGVRWPPRHRQYHVPENPRDFWSVITVSAGHTAAFLTLQTISADELYRNLAGHVSEETPFAVDEDLRVPLNLHPVARNRRIPRPVYPLVGLSAVEYLIRAGVPVLYDEDFLALRRTASETIGVYPSPGRPAEPQLAAGRGTPLHRGSTLSVPGGTLGGRTVSSDELAQLMEEHSDCTWFVHPQVADVAKMASAEPFEDPRLRQYQKEAVGLHLATDFGFVNASEPGTGKTIMSLRAMRERSQLTDEPYRALVVAEANVRHQWTGETHVWFPEAEVVKITTRADASKLAEALASDKPVVGIISYALIKGVEQLAEAAGEDTDDSGELTSEAPDEEKAPASRPRPRTAATGFAFNEGGQGMLFTFDGDAADEVAADIEDDEAEPEEKTLAELLFETHWHDLIADEAAVLRNSGTRQSRALWALRDHSDVAIALTGTPVTRSGIDDLGRLVSWVRGARRLFAGKRLSKMFDVASDADLKELNRALGPLIFRRNKSEIADELPELESSVVRLNPTPSELALVDAARNELKKAYEELVTLLEIAEQTDPDNPEIAEVRAELSKAQGAVVGGTTLARMAASDPAAVATSESTSAELLASSGLVAAAVADGGTKRRWTTQFCVDLADEGKQAVVFTEFSSVALLLVEALTEAGLRVGKVIGGGGTARDRAIEDFRAGELDVLVCTSAGKRGLNLQTASAVIHFDLPWTPDDVAQRTARVERIGASADEVRVLYPVLAGTIDERIIALVAARSAEAVRALDISRGVDGAGTDMGRILAGLVDQVDVSELDVRQATLLDVTRALVGA